MAIGFSVRLTPRAGRDAIGGVDPDGTLRVRVAAPPVDGAANRALVRFIAAVLDVAPSAVRIEAGESARLKRLSVAGADAAAVSARWPGLRLTEDR